MIKSKQKISPENVKDFIQMASDLYISRTPISRNSSGLTLMKGGLWVADDPLANIEIHQERSRAVRYGSHAPHPSPLTSPTNPVRSVTSEELKGLEDIAEDMASKILDGPINEKYAEIARNLQQLDELKLEKTAVKQAILKEAIIRRINESNATEPLQSTQPAQASRFTGVLARNNR